VALDEFGVAGEPTVAECFAAGADLVTFSGDKLFSGPQAGFLAGREDLVQQAARHPIARAVRPDKLTLAALAATLAAWKTGAWRFPSTGRPRRPRCARRKHGERILRALPGGTLGAVLLAGRLRRRSPEALRVRALALDARASAAKPRACASGRRSSRASRATASPRPALDRPEEDALARRLAEGGDAIIAHDAASRGCGSWSWCSGAVARSGLQEGRAPVPSAAANPRAPTPL
jgi:L-seryl-tRNA(Ser) seleniumtransferase